MNKYQLRDSPAPSPVLNPSAHPQFWALALRQLYLAARLSELRYRATGVERVALGDQVSLYNLDEAAHFQLEIVEPRAADPAGRRISCFSPLGVAILGRRKGDSFSVDLLGRRYEFVVMGVVKHTRTELTAVTRIQVGGASPALSK